MLYAIRCVDAEDVASVRDEYLTPHKDYLKGRADVLVVGGALLGDDGEPYGSLYIVNVPDRAAAEAFSQADPFTSAGVFGEVTISAMRKSHWHPEVA